MAHVVIISANGQSKTVEGADGLSVMEAARRAGIDGIIGECGGACSCATCHVYVDEAWQARIGAATGSEADMLEFAEEVKPSSRLSCQITLGPAVDGLVLHLPSVQG